MSEQKTIAGKLRRVDLQGLPIDKYAKYIIKKNGLEKYIELYDSSLDVILHETKNEFFYDQNNKELYRIIEMKDIYDDTLIVKDDNGDYSFFTTFYNGSTCLDEMLQDGFNNLTN